MEVIIGRITFTAIALLLLVIPAQGQSRTKDGGYTATSLQGTWAIVLEHGDNDSFSVGITVIDANGLSTGDLVRNWSSPDGRTLSTGPTSGRTWTVDPEGQPYAVGMSGLSGMIGFFTRVELVDGVKRVTEMVGGYWSRSRTSLFTYTYRRLPDEGTFTAASLQGTWEAEVLYGPHMGISHLIMTIDTNGNSSGGGTLDLPDPNGTRLVASATTTGTYTLNADGVAKATSTIILPDGTTQTNTWDVLITQAEVVGGVKRATEIFAAQREAATAVSSNALATMVLKRLPE